MSKGMIIIFTPQGDCYLKSKVDQCIAELEKQLSEAEDLIAGIGDVNYEYNGEIYMESKIQGVHTRREARDAK